MRLAAVRRRAELADRTIGVDGALHAASRDEVAHLVHRAAVARGPTQSSQWNTGVVSAGLTGRAVDVGDAVYAQSERRAAHLPGTHPRTRARNWYLTPIREADLACAAIGDGDALYA